MLEPVQSFSRRAVAGPPTGDRRHRSTSVAPGTDEAATPDTADRYWTVTTVLGPAYVAYNDLGISALMRADTAEAFVHAFQAEIGRSVLPAPPPPELATAVTDYLNGHLSLADARRQLSFDLRGTTAFERAVLLKTFEIPHGEVRPYSWIAREIGQPRAVRAVGSAIGRNPIPLLIPCHRVIRRDGRIGEYGLGGPSAKWTLLAAEGVDPRWLESLARAGVRYLATPATQTYCFPTCQVVRQERAELTIPFPSDDAAEAAGYHPCPRCRPSGIPGQHELR